MKAVTSNLRTVLLGAMVATLASGVAFLVSPSSAAAQSGPCVDCGVVIGQPGNNLDCIAVMEGFQSCILGPGYCHVEDECEGVSALDFSDDGTARFSPDGAQIESRLETLDRTCDGVMLHVAETSRKPERHALDGETQVAQNLVI